VKKKILILAGTSAGVAAALVAAAAALPLWFGMQAESAYQAMLAETAQGGDFTVTGSNFQRGWLESTADTTVTVTGTPLTVSMLHRISHGPLPMDDDFTLTPVLARVKSQISIGLPAGIAKLPPITATTTVFLAGNSQTHLDMAAIKSGAADGAGIEWKGLNGDVATSADFKTSKGELSAPLLRIGNALSISRLKLSFDQQKSPSNFSLGTVGFSADQLQLEGADSKNSVDGLGLSSTLQEAGGNLNAGITLQFREARTGESKQGPGQIVLQIRKLDVATLAKFRNEVRELRKQKLAPEQANMMVLGKTLELLGNLAKKSPELEITKLSFKTADGEVTARAKFVLDGSHLDVSGNPMLMLKALNGEGEVTLPESVVRLLASLAVKRDIEALKASGKLSEAEAARLTPKRIAAIAQQALQDLPEYKDSVVTQLRLIPDGPNFKIAAVLKNGQLMVNNAPLQLP
jgi:uncharacterized protein YdgA (DUF945 family)